MKKKMMFVLPVVLLLVLGAGYKMVLAKEVPVKKKVEGTLVALDPEFVVNLSGGHYGKVNVALLLDAHGAAGGHAAGPVVLEQNAVIRAVVTDELTGLPMDALIDRRKREKLVHRIEKALKKRTDEHVREVLLTDIAVQ